MKVKFFNYSTIIGMFFALVEQVMVAGSIIIIAELSKSIETGTGFLIWLVLYALSLTVVYIPTTFVNFFFNKAKYITYEHYIITFSDRACGLVSHFFSNDSSSNQESYFTHEAWMIIEEDYDFLKDMSQLLFNIVLSVAVLSYLIDKSLLIAYAVAVPLTFLCVLALKRLVSERSDTAQSNRSKLMQTLASGWDTILIGNKHNVSIWKSNFQAKCDKSSKAARGLDLTLDISAFVMVIICAAPVVMVIARSLYDAIGNISMMTLLVATIPRQLGTIQYLSEAINLFVNLSDKARRTKQLSNNLSLESLEASRGEISWDSICLESNDGMFKLKNFEDLYNHTDNFSRGRYTLTGDNGSGKTTILANIKRKLKDKAYLMPSKSKMIFCSDLEQKEFSAGEKAKDNLFEIFSSLHKDGVSVLLLDEWGANLDLGNKKRVDKVIDELSSEFCIIEVVHRDAVNIF